MVLIPLAPLAIRLSKYSFSSGSCCIAEICRREGIAAPHYYRWSKDFLEAGKKPMNGDTMREANTEEVTELRSENDELKQVVAELMLKNRVLKKSTTGYE